MEHYSSDYRQNDIIPLSKVDTKDLAIGVGVIASVGGLVKLLSKTPPAAYIPLFGIALLATFIVAVCYKGGECTVTKDGINFKVN